jgi:hypothetical protein
MNRCTRRRFLGGFATAGFAVPALVPEGGVRVVRGRVLCAGRGRAGVAVSDGATVARTDGDGRFLLPTTGEREFVFVRVPSDCRLGGRWFRRIEAAGDVRFDLEPERDTGPDHHFLAVADPQPTKPGELARLRSESIPALRDADAAFGVICGDVVGDAPGLMPGVAEAFGSLDLPFFALPGNHDLDFAFVERGRATRSFRRRFGPTSYSFDRGAVRYVVLDNVAPQPFGYRGEFGYEQLRWLAQDLADLEAGRTVVVFAHIPLRGSMHDRHGRTPCEADSTADRESLYRLLEPYRAHVVVGHMHEQEHVFAGGVHEHVLGALCGAWWNGPVCADGTPSGHAVFEARGEEIRWRYRASGRAPAEQFALHAPGALPEHPELAVANVWDWDPRWEVRMIEDGRVRGPMQRWRDVDPTWRALRFARGERPSPLHRDYHLTDHLFVAPVGEGAKTIRVEATNPWGETFAEELRLSGAPS